MGIWSVISSSTTLRPWISYFIHYHFSFNTKLRSLIYGHRNFVHDHFPSDLTLRPILNINWTLNQADRLPTVCWQIVINRTGRCSWVLRRSLTSQVISVAFYIEREKSDKFCSDDLISAWGSFTCLKSTTRDQRLYFPSEGSHTMDFYGLKNFIDPMLVWIREHRIQMASMITTGPPGSSAGQWISRTAKLAPIKCAPTNKQYSYLVIPHKQSSAVFPVNTFANTELLFEQRLRKCLLEIQLMAPFEDLPHIDMDTHCSYLVTDFTGLVMTNTALY